MFFKLANTRYNTSSEYGGWSLVDRRALISRERASPSEKVSIVDAPIRSYPFHRKTAGNPPENPGEPLIMFGGINVR